MTPEQRKQITALRNCTFLPGSFDKRFVVDISNKPDDFALSEKQSAFLEKLVHRYRKQIGQRA